MSTHAEPEPAPVATRRWQPAAAVSEGDPGGILALQQAIGNRGVQALMRQATTTAPPPTAPPPATPQLRADTWLVLLTQPTHYQWHDLALRRLVDDPTSNIDAIARHLRTLAPADLDIARRDLELGLDDYIHALTESRRDARREARALGTGGLPQADRDAIGEHLQRLTDLRRRIEALLMDIYAGVARGAAPGVSAPAGGWGSGRAPAALTAGTHTPTADERRRLRDVIVPEREVDPTTGRPLAFESTVTGVTADYRTRIRQFLLDLIDRLHHDLVDNKGAADRGTVVSWDRYEDMARAAKQIVDATFGAYSQRPAMRRNVNLIDLWESRGRDQSSMSRDQRVAEARSLLEYFVDAESGIRAIDLEHHADHRRRTEAGILRAVIDELARSKTTELQEINRGWEGEQDPATHRIFMQRWPNDPAGDTAHIAQRTAFWDTLQIFMHEYLHSLTNDTYDAFANSLGGQRQNTLVEGMTSLMTEIAWARADPSDPALRRLVEGPVLSQLPFDPATVPDISNRRYSSYEQALRIVQTVGIQNVFAAYFLGKTDLVRPAR